MASSRYQIPSFLLVLALGAGASPWSACLAQEPEKTAQASPEAGADLSKLRQATAEDLAMETAGLLAGVPDSAVQDAVWKFSPNKILSKGSSGKSNRMMVVPVVVAKGDYKVGDPPVGPGEGRFIAWYLPVPEAKDKEAAASLPPGAPRVASAFAVTGGRIHWSVDRFASTMDLASGGTVGDERSFYLFALDRQRLKALVPLPYKKGAPYVRPAKVRGEPADAYLAREQKARAEYDKREADARAAAEARRAQYAQASDRVGSLPDKLSAPAPALVYAVYYVPAPPATPGYQRPVEATFVGHPQGPWKPSPAAWAALLALAKGGVGAAPGGRQAAEAQLKSVAADLEASREHPLALRAAAAALAASGMLEGAPVGTPAYAIADKVLGAKDPEARSRMMRAILATGNSAAKASLLARAVAVSEATGDRAMNDQLRLSALRVLLNAKETDTDAKRVDAVNKALADASGAPPKDVLAEFFTPFGGMPLARARVAAAQFRFQDIADPKRRAAALAAVAERCGTSVLAGVLVDENMLGEGSPVAPLEALAAVASAGTAKVPLYRAEHGLLQRLVDKDGAVREAAWRALPSCQVRAIEYAKDVDKFSGDGLPAIIARIIDAGLAEKTAPEGLAPFLAAHATAWGQVREVAVQGLARELGDGGEAGSKQAFKALSSPTLAPMFDGALQALGAEARFRAVAGCYAAAGQSCPLPAGLLLSDKESARTAGWFATEFAKGKLPLPAQYASLPADQAQLMDWVMAQEPRLARAAVAILVYREGGDDAQAAAVADKMLAEPYKLRAQMERKWEACRGEIFMARVKASEGERELRAAVCRKGGKAWIQGEGKAVALKCDGGSVSTGIPGVVFQTDAGKKALVLSDASLLDRVDPRMRAAFGLEGFSGALEFAWVAPCWEATVHPEAGTEVLLRLAPVGWKKLPDLPSFKDAK